MIRLSIYYDQGCPWPKKEISMQIFYYAGSENLQQHHVGFIFAAVATLPGYHDEIPDEDKHFIFDILFENSNVTLNFDRIHLSIWSNDHLELMVSLLKSFWVVPVARCWHEAARRDPNEAFSRFFFAS